MRRIILSLFILFMALSCKNSAENGSKEINKPSIESIKYLALGDSYTIGESVDSTERWPVVLFNKLKVEEPSIDEVQIIAKTGWTTRNLLDAISKENLENQYSLVTLLIGVNNQFQKRDTSEYRKEFVELLSKSVNLTGNDSSKVIVVSIPDYGVTPFGISYGKEKTAREIDVFNAINFEESQKAGVFYVDITPISKEAEYDPSLIAVDDLHPSAIMYQRWVDLILPLAKQILISDH